MSTKRSKGSILLVLLIVMIGAIAVIATATQIRKDELANGEIAVDALIESVSPVEVKYEDHIGEGGNKVYDLLMYQTIKLRYNIDNKSESITMPNMLICQQEVTSHVENLEKTYADESSYKLGSYIRLYIMENDHSRFRMAQNTGKLSMSLGITLIVIEILVSVLAVVLLIKHTMRVMFEFV